MSVDVSAQAAYIIAALLFILALASLSRHDTARACPGRYHHPGRAPPHLGIRVTRTAGFSGMRRTSPACAPSPTWVGFLNTHYSIDPAKDIATALMTQSLPFWDPRS